MTKSRTSFSGTGVTDAFWLQVESLLPLPQRDTDHDYLRKPGAGRKPKPSRLVFEAILYVLRNGCQWKALPANPYGSASVVHKRYLEWLDAGVFDELWVRGLASSDDMAGIAWRWQCIGTRDDSADVAYSLGNRAPITRKIWRPAIDHRERKKSLIRAHSKQKLPLQPNF